MGAAFQIAVLGMSAGGVEALQKILVGLPSTFDLPLAVVQHLPPTMNVDVELVFRRSTSRRLVEIEDKMPLERGTVYFAPPGYHVSVEGDGTFSLSLEPPVQFTRPSIDVLFESAARAFGPGVIGILLTGANTDGAAGLKAIQDAGGLTFVQDPETAEAPLMPQEAIRRFRPDAVLGLREIAVRLNEVGGREVV